jgi:hypothetical protein
MNQIQFYFTQIDYDEANNWVSLSSLTSSSSSLSLLTRRQIYLFDSNLKRMYWFNLQDSSSSWMSQEDQEYYSNASQLSQQQQAQGQGQTVDPRKTIVAKVRRASVLQSAQYRRTTTQELLEAQHNLQEGQ